RPRNLGTDLARGEYVLYSDHDDIIYPDALRAGYEFAHAAGADALNAKEARTDRADWALATYQEDREQVLDRTDVFALTPTNPHKLYRRAFLDEHEIRFREGGRVLWEDAFFNVLVAEHAEVVATLASTPFYHWYTTEQSGSTSFVRASREWWYWLEELVTAIRTDLAAPHLDAQRTALMRHQYSTRLLDSFNDRFPKRSSKKRALIFDHARRLQQEAFGEEFDGLLSVSDRLRATLLRRGHRHVLNQLALDDPALRASFRATAVDWQDDGTLQITLQTTWHDSEGAAPRLRGEGDRIFKVLPPEYSAEFSDADLDVTDEVQGAAVELTVRDLDSRITWTVPTESDVWHTTGRDGAVELGATSHARIDPRTAVFGKPLDRGTWLIGGSATLAGRGSARSVRSALRPAIRITADGVQAAYARPSGELVLDLDQAGAPLTDLVTPTGDAHRAGSMLSVRLRGLPTATDAVISTTVKVNSAGRAALIASDARTAFARLRGRSAPEDGWRRVPATIRIVRGEARLELTAPDGPLRIRLGALVPHSRREYAL
ncbi:MAG: hypothetical protein QM607_13185, partial [Microbacterium sp.]